MFASVARKDCYTLGLSGLEMTFFACSKLVDFARGGGGWGDVIWWVLTSLIFMYTKTSF